MGENSDNDWLIFDDGDDLHPAAMTVGGIGVLRVANVRFCERAALRDRPVLAELRLRRMTQSACFVEQTSAVYLANVRYPRSPYGNPVNSLFPESS